MDCAACLKAMADADAARAKEERKSGRLLMIPEKYRGISTDRTELLESKLNKSLFITGRHGVGKTVFLYSLAKRCIEQDRKIRIIRFTAWIMELQSIFRSENGNPFESAKSIAEFPGTLFIDDLGAEKTTEYVRQIVYYVLDEREQGELRTVITSNYSLDEINANIDPRSSSRIAGMCEVLIFKGEDRRLGKGGTR
jgi:DNA replication protein DnaC